MFVSGKIIRVFTEGNISIYFERTYSGEDSGVSPISSLSGTEINKSAVLIIITY